MNKGLCTNVLVDHYQLRVTNVTIITLFTCVVQMVEYKHKWSESQADLQQQLKQAKKVRKNALLGSY